jgi:hypothetical protein
MFIMEDRNKCYGLVSLFRRDICPTFICNLLLVIGIKSYPIVMIYFEVELSVNRTIAYKFVQPLEIKAHNY